MGELLMTLPLYFEANPPPYVVAAPQKKGLILSAAGVGQTELPITGITGDINVPLCGTPSFIGILDEYASEVIQENLTERDLETTYIRQGEFLTEDLTIKEGFDPLRTLLISGVIGREIAGGKTIYGVDIITDCQDALFVGVASKQLPKEDFIFRKWQRIVCPNFIARPVVSGREFRLLLYTKGAGRFNIFGITVWMKLTDRRGFNTSPQGVKQEGT
jgi:hypothetical protein